MATRYENLARILRDPWYAPSDDERGGVEAQLKIEVGEGHLLKGQPVRLLARRDGTDDALFALDDGRVAQVHMTWRSSAETNPLWPAAVMFASLEEWLAATLDKDA